MIINLLRVLYHKVLGRKTDFFLDYKFKKLESYYGERCLDIGTGTGRFAHFLMDQGKSVECIDVVNKTEFILNFQLFDGKQIPMTSKSINTSLIFFVLHHTDSQIDLLKECKRVTNDKIIIGEDIIENWFDKVMGRIHLGTSPWSKSENGFRTDLGWKQLFNRLELQLIDEIIIPRSLYPVYPISRKIYVLKNE